MRILTLAKIFVLNGEKRFESLYSIVASRQSNFAISHRDEHIKSLPEDRIGCTKT